MERSKSEELLSSEKKGRIRISRNDPTKYPDFYYWKFDRILKWSSEMIGPNTSESCAKFKANNWDHRYWGYDEWASPQHDDGMARHMRRMNSQFMYNKFQEGAIPDSPDVQLNKLFAAPLERALKERTTTNEHKDMQRKIFVLKYSLAPFMSSFIEGEIARYNDKQVRVWRLISCYGETNLDTLHDRILGPTMGWSRHYHSYKYVVPTNGACFGPKISDAIDHMHAQNSYVLDARKYQLCHVLRKPGEKLAYIYDLGDQWVHLIELLQVAEKGDILNLPPKELKVAPKPSDGDRTKDWFADSERPYDSQMFNEQIREVLTKIYGSKLPELYGAQLLAGQINCPPEDSNGCQNSNGSKGMGKYGNILKKGPRYRSREAAESLNWSEHGIRSAYNFDLEAHAQRLSSAISGKSSSRTGHKVMNMPLVDHELLKNLLPKTKPGEKRRDGRLGNPMTETIKTRPDKAYEAVCSTCGRQPNIEKGKKTPLARCSRCKGAWYCGKDCQQSDWENHKARCNALKKERAAYKQEAAELK